MATNFCPLQVKRFRIPHRFRSGRELDQADNGVSSSASSQDTPPLGYEQANQSAFEANNSRIAANPTAPADTSSHLGLELLFTPTQGHSVDIVFVHGLGGHRRKTWRQSGQGDSHFWPGTWLPQEPGLESARIHTFGYAAAWKRRNVTPYSIRDFAKELLLQLHSATDEQGQPMRIGEKPIIFVAHSMGGLVVKKAYLFGYDHEDYHSIIANVSAIIFLSTPHRGADLAKRLNFFYGATLRASKPFVKDLERGSMAIEDLNESFRHFAPSLRIISFYEMEATSFGYKCKLIVEKDSAKLGYPSEITRPINANHQNVCKFDNRSNANYVAVRNGLIDLVASSSLPSGYQESVDNAMLGQGHSQIQGVTEHGRLLGSSLASEIDYRKLRGLRMPGTCSWFLHNSKVDTWLGERQTSVLSYTAPPATGKSVLSTAVIGALQDQELLCQYFFFKHSEEAKASASSAVKAIAFQIASAIPECRQEMQLLPPQSLNLDSEDVTLVWGSFLAPLLRVATISRPLYWVIDGLDECQNPHELLACLSEIQYLDIPIKIILFSRDTNAISIGLRRLSWSVPVEALKLDEDFNNIKDLRAFVDEALSHIKGDEESKQALRTQIRIRCQRNFLWAKLLTDELMESHTREEMQRAVTEFLPGMTQLYQRMERDVLQTPIPSDIRLVRAVLEWAVCSGNTITLKELEQVLKPDCEEFVDLEWTIKNLCGHFALVAPDGTLVTFHSTAGQYLTSKLDNPLLDDAEGTPTRLLFNKREAQGRIFDKTLGTFQTPCNPREAHDSFETLQARYPLLSYDARMWPHHAFESIDPQNLDLAPDKLMGILSMNTQLWVFVLATMKQLENVTRASKNMSYFMSEARTRMLLRDCMTDSQKEVLGECIIQFEAWAGQLERLIEEYGEALLERPAMVYAVFEELS